MGRRGSGDGVLATRVLGLTMLASSAIGFLGLWAGVENHWIGAALVVAAPIVYLGSRFDRLLRTVAAGLVFAGLPTWAAAPTRAQSAVAFVGLLGISLLVGSHPRIRSVEKRWAEWTDRYVEAAGRKLGYTLAAVRERLRIRS